MTDLHPATKSIILLVCGFFCGAVAFGVAKLLVVVASLVWDSFGPWSLLLALAGIAWVAHNEKHR